MKIGLIVDRLDYGVHGIGIFRHLNNPGDTTNSYGINEPGILYVGNLELRKNVDDIIASLYKMTT